MWEETKVERRERRVVAVGSNCGAPSIVKSIVVATTLGAKELLLSNRAVGLS